MKKVWGFIIAIALVFSLTACVPEGISPDFYTKATESFNEIDDDTMEMELSDKDDILNFELLTGYAISDKEEQVVQAIQTIVRLQPKMIDGDKKVFSEYLKARVKYYSVMEIDKFSQRTFTFTEE